jgi:predicted amino acid-binding ACT domain protein
VDQGGGVRQLGPAREGVHRAGDPKKARRGKVGDRFEQVAKALDLPDGEHLFAALGRGDIGPSQVFKELWPDAPEPEPDRPPSAFERLVSRVRGKSPGVRIQGMENLMVRYSQCCQPVPGDEVIGYITRGRGVSIHRTDCPNVLNLADHPERRVEIEWEAEVGERFFVRLEMEGTDRRGLVADIASTITALNTNIKSVNIQAEEMGMRGEFVVEVENLDHLKRVMNAIRRVKGVLSVERREHFGTRWSREISDNRDESPPEASCFLVVRPSSLPPASSTGDHGSLESRAHSVLDVYTITQSTTQGAVRRLVREARLLRVNHESKRVSPISPVFLQSMYPVCT